MTERRFIQCDVFTSVPTKGNGLAVVVDGEGLSEAQMRDFAAWTNLAETTFLFPPSDPEADYAVRIFTPQREMPFAGHPTLGSCAAWLATGGAPATAGVVKQECKIGIVEIDVSGKVPSFVAPDTEVRPLSPSALDAICGALEVEPGSVLRSAHLDNGPEWQVIELAGAEAVLALDAGRVNWPDFKGVSALGAHPPGSPCAFEVRNLSPSSGMSEDPITGSLVAAIARWMQADGRLQPDTVIAQGTNIGRCGRVFISFDPRAPERLLVGGEVQILIDGTVRL